MIAKGTGLDKLKAEIDKNNSEAAKFIEKNVEIASAPITVLKPGQYPGLHLVSYPPRLCLNVPLNHISKSALTLHNTGSVAIRFEWVKTDSSSALKSSRDKVQTFFLSYTKGVIAPGTTLEFPVVFKSNKPGIFSEIWKLITSPSLPQDQEITSVLQGYAIEKEIVESDWVDKLLKSRM